jgi:UDP-N-acetylglucosamine--N-acetylmuramyl-(pentapeptide) pyrophosphoryl-undecaprenol N-acetylglucosamine transferase
MNTIFLTGGGTAGHIAPNIALLPYLRGYEVHYFGEAGSMEERMISAYPQVTFHALPCIKFHRSLSPKNIKIPFVLASGISKAKKFIKELKPKAVFSKGGYAALPMAMAAYKKKVPLIIHESDISMGLSNRLVAKKSRYVCTSFPSLAEKFDNGFFTGTPIRRELYEGNAEAVNRKLGFKKNGRPNLLIFGGSQGALAINQAAEGAIKELCAYFNVLHIAGKHKFDGSHENYRRLEFCDYMADCYAWADYAVTRAGAGTLSEITALKIPSLVIPLPKSDSSRGDQVQNAAYYKNLGVIEVMEQDSLSCGSIVSETVALISKRQNLISAMNANPGSDGTRKIAELLNSFNV